jgi:hypothetical protein
MPPLPDLEDTAVFDARTDAAVITGVFRQALEGVDIGDARGLRLQCRNGGQRLFAKRSENFVFESFDAFFGAQDLILEGFQLVARWAAVTSK